MTCSRAPLPDAPRRARRPPPPPRRPGPPADDPDRGPAVGGIRRAHATTCHAPGPEPPDLRVSRPVLRAPAVRARGGRHHADPRHTRARRPGHGRHPRLWAKPGSHDRRPARVRGATGRRRRRQRRRDRTRSRISVRAALDQAIAETREVRDGRMLARAPSRRRSATAVYVVLVWLLLRFGRWLTFRMLKLAGRLSARASGSAAARSCAATGRCGSRTRCCASPAGCCCCWSRPSG